MTLCELCASSDTRGNNLQSFEVPGQQESSLESHVMLCTSCRDQITNPDSMNPNHWYCLRESMWSENPAVKVLTWRLLNLLNQDSWAQDSLDQFDLEPELLAWAKSQEASGSSADSASQTRDSNGTMLVDGDAVTLIKDLDVKGAGFTAKRGTLVKKITLTDDPENVEGRINGTQIVLKTKFLKKA